MFKLSTLFRSMLRSRSCAAFDSSTARSERVALEDNHSVRAYWFDGERLLFDAEFDWRFICSLPGNASRAMIASIAAAYFRGFEQGRGELRSVGVSEEFFELARQYAQEEARHAPI